MRGTGGIPALCQVVRMCHGSLSFLLAKTFPSQVPRDASTPPTAKRCLVITETGETLGRKLYLFLPYVAKHIKRE